MNHGVMLRMKSLMTGGSGIGESYSQYLASIEILKNATEQEDSIGKKGSLVVRIRRGHNIKTQLADLKRLIEKLEPSASAEPLYKLSATHSIVDKALRANLRLGELFTQTGSIEDAAEQYCDRVENWNEKIKK